MHSYTYIYTYICTYIYCPLRRRGLLFVIIVVSCQSMYVNSLVVNVMDISRPFLGISARPP